jgi:hypothetical protein
MYSKWGMMAMVDFLLFMGFSILEGMGVFYLIFKAFRFKEGIFDPRSLMINTMISLSSYVLTIFEYSSFVPLITLFIMIIMFSILFGINYLYVLKMSITGYICYAIVNVATVSIVGLSGIISSVQLNPFSGDAHIVQSVSFLITVLIAFLLRKNKLGFTYIPIEKIRIKYNFINKVLLITTVLIIIVFGLLAMFAIEKNDLSLILTVGVFAIIASGVLTYVSLKKEYIND